MKKMFTELLTKIKNTSARLSFLIEEIFPFFMLIIHIAKINKKMKSSTKNDYVEYLQLEDELLHNRLTEEHDRAIKIDDKTSKFTLALSLSLSIIAAIYGSFVKILPSIPSSSSKDFIVTSIINKFVPLLCLISSCYMLIASIIALGAFKTLARYGYGTKFLIEKQMEGKESLSRNLFFQEKMNIIRQLRNESAYQCIRNGLLLLLIALIVSVISLFL